MGPLKELKENYDKVATESDVRMMRCWELEVTFETVKFWTVKIA